MKSVVILGCGPAGLFAAQACELSGIVPVIISQKKQSIIYGAQYLHHPIPGLVGKDDTFLVHTMRNGTSEGYAERVYGDAQRVTSWDILQPVTPAWELRAAYQRAWEKFEPVIVDQPVDANDVGELSATFDLVISTIPRWTICRNPQHRFPSRAIMVRPKVEFEIGGAPDNYVIYNGTPEGIWYRCSSIRGYESTEAIAHPSLVGQGWDIGFKIMDTNCDCHLGVVHCGRMGRWQSGILTHDAFFSAVEAISDRFGVARPE